MSKPTRLYALEVTYADSTVTRFELKPEELLFEMAERIMSNETHANVKTWKITPFRPPVGESNDE